MGSIIAMAVVVPVTTVVANNTVFYYSNIPLGVLILISPAETIMTLIEEKLLLMVGAHDVCLKDGHPSAQWITWKCAFATLAVTNTVIALCAIYILELCHNGM